MRSSAVHLLVALTLFGATACGSWHTAPAPSRVPVDSVLSRTESGPIRVTLTTGHRVKLSEPMVLEDTLFGTGDNGERRDIPVGEIKSVETWNEDTVRTDVMLGVAGLVLTYGVGLALGVALSAIGG
ncbi:MAG TPA: hypothetical protein VF483_11655 [Gemmatimonadaceae bacterium]